MEKVKAMLAALRENYISDLPNHIDEIEQLLLELERDGFELEICRELYRRVHSLKGSAGTYGMNFVSDICHPLEDHLSHLIESPNLLQQGAIGHALEYIDLVRKACFAYSNDIEPGSELKQSLQSLRRRHSKTSFAALIVEPSDVVVAVLREILMASGFRIEVTTDGYVALGRVLSEQFDLLVSGLEVPRLNGMALVSAVQKSGGRVSKTKTVLLTTSNKVIAEPQPDYILKKNADLKQNFHHCIEDVLAKIK